MPYPCISKGGRLVTGCFNKLINFKRTVLYDYMLLINIIDSREYIVKYLSSLTDLDVHMLAACINDSIVEYYR